MSSNNCSRLRSAFLCFFPSSSKRLANSSLSNLSVNLLSSSKSLSFFFASNSILSNLSSNSFFNLLSASVFLRLSFNCPLNFFIKSSCNSCFFKKSLILFWSEKLSILFSFSCLLISFKLSCCSLDISKDLSKFLRTDFWSSNSFSFSWLAFTNPELNTWLLVTLPLWIASLSTTSK